MNSPRFGVWKCLQCSVEKPATAHQMRKTYCSSACMSLGYSVRMVGEENPNFSNAGVKTCNQCGAEYCSYVKTRQFCSRKCANDARPKKEKIERVIKPIAKLKPKFIPKSTMVECAHCSKEFRKYPSQTRLFCSYKCHLDSGGAFRAGMAASKATMKYGAKKDANHNEIFEELRKNCAVYDLSAVGRGVPDGLAWVKDAWHLFDVKNPATGYGKRGLNPVQTKWLNQWEGGPVFLIYTTEEAKLFSQGDFSKIKSVKNK